MRHALPVRQDLEAALAAVEAGRTPELDLGWLAGLIDHTLLKPGVGEAELAKLCEEAKAHHFATVCVRSENISFCVKALEGSLVKPIAVVGFPDGDTPTGAKVAETKQAVAAGAQEIDMVIAPALLHLRKLQEAEADIRAVVDAAGDAPVKVILETCLLSEEEKVIGCTLARAAGAAFVKTSTGFSTGGATVSDISLMRRTVGEAFGVKASGGVRTLADALRMVLAGANRIGTSNGVGIVAGKSSPAGQTGVY